MKEKTQKKSPIKQRILHFIEYLGISKREFYQNINVSRGTLESPTGITEDILAKFIAEYPDINIVWLMTGEGNMFKTEKILVEDSLNVSKNTSSIEDKLLDIISIKDKEINNMSKELGRLENEIEHLRRGNTAGLGGVGGAAVADVG